MALRLVELGGKYEGQDLLTPPFVVSSIASIAAACGRAGRALGMDFRRPDSNFTLQVGKRVGTIA